MKPFQKIVLFVGCCALTTGSIVHHVKEGEMIDRIKAVHMKTICVGRFLIDVPEKAIVSYRSASISGWDISSQQETDTQFDNKLKEKEAQLKLEKNSHGGISLDLIRVVRHGDLHGSIFVFNRKWLDGYNDGIKTIETAVSMLAIVRIQSITYEFYSKLVSDTDIDDLEKIIKKMSWRDIDEIPERAGFCFDRGFLNEPLSADQAEFTGIFLGLADHPDLAIALTSMAGIDPGKTLLQRDAANDVKQAYFSRFHTLREGPRTLNGIPGEEVLERVDEPNGSTLQGFMWESLSMKDDVYLPNLILEFDTGHGKPGSPINSSLTDAEALALWDKISSSLRRRPISADVPHATSN